MRIAVIGAGAWGTALSLALTRHDRHSVKLWALEKEVAALKAQYTPKGIAKQLETAATKAYKAGK